MTLTSELRARPEHQPALWLFWVAPIFGAALAGVVYPITSREEKR